MIAALVATLLMTAQPASAASTDVALHTIVHGGQERRWAEIVPPTCAGVRARCMVVVLLHGGQGGIRRRGGGPAAGLDRALVLADRTGMAAAARREGFVLLVPASVAGNWNDGRPGIADGIDDVGFIRAMLADTATRVAVRREETVAAGVSNGGLMGFRLACEAPTSFRAIAAVVANMGQTLSGQCRPERGVDIVQVLGRRDPLMPYDGGDVGGGRAGGRGGVLSADASLRFWAERLGGAAPADSRIDADVTLRRVMGPRGRIEQYSVASYGHGWPGMGGEDRPMQQAVRGQNPSGFDTTRRILDFFRSSASR